MFNANTLEDILIRNRLVSSQAHIDYLHVKVLEIFRYSGLDLTLPKRILESRVTQDGYTVVYEHEGNLYCTQTMPSGKQDVYGECREVHFTHSNEGESIPMTRTIGVDAVMVRNDAALIGLDPLISEFAAFEAQAKVSFLEHFTMLRSTHIIQAKDERSYASAMEFEQQIRNGVPTVVLSEDIAGGGMDVFQTPSSHNSTSELISLVQFITSRYYSELGITLNNNMKSQYVNEAEMNKSTGMPLIYNMLACRREAVDEINALFGRNIKVALSEEWNDEMESDEAPATPVEPTPEEDPDEETHSTEEVIDAADATIGEDDAPTDDSASDDADSETDTDEDDDEGRGVEAKEDDDEE